MTDMLALSLAKSATMECNCVRGVGGLPMSLVEKDQAT